MEGVLKVVRRDNKRGYCTCSSATASVDQLVVQRPGRMLRSRDPNAEKRYLVEIDESLQANAIRRAWNGDFDVVADLDDKGSLVLRAFDTEHNSSHNMPEREEHANATGSLADERAPSLKSGIEKYNAASSVVAAYIRSELAREYANPEKWPEEKLYQCLPCAANV